MSDTSSPAQAGSSQPTPAAPPGAAPAASPQEIEHLLRQSAFINAFSISIPGQPDIPIPPPGGGADPNQMIGIVVFEQPHRFDVQVHPPRGGQGIKAKNVIGSEHAFLTLHWMVTPDDYVSLPDVQPPPTLFDPSRSQRFTMLLGEFVFDDKGKNRFHGFGTGRTFPIMVDGKPQLALGANGNILQGWGIFEGVQGSYVINGHISPPHGLYLQMVFRLVDLTGKFKARSELTPLQSIPQQDANEGSTYLTLFGEADPNAPIEQHFSADGRLVGATVSEVLRIAHLDFDKGRDGEGLRTKQASGPVVAHLRTRLNFDPMNPATPGTALSPIPIYTTSTVITFFGAEGGPGGTIQANLVEGRGFRSDIPGVPYALRIVGFGPVLSDQGTGDFAGVQGMLSVNSAISLAPPALYNFYVIRLIDPQGKFRFRGKGGSR